MYIPEDRSFPLLLSARSADGLRIDARRLRDYLGRKADLAPADVGWSLTGARAALEHRAVILGVTREDLLPSLDALAQGQPSATLSQGAAIESGHVVFVFPGQGPQWDGMGAQLLASCDVFRQQADACAEAFAPYLDWSVTDVLSGSPDAPPLAGADVVQPALFTLMVSLAALWRSYGVEPAAVVGSCIGEVAAAYVSGALSLGDSARVAARWSQLQATLAGRGEMAAVRLPASQVAGRLTPWEGRIGIGAIYGPASIVVSGDSDAVREFVDSVHDSGIRVRQVAIDLAVHSPHIDAIIEQLFNDLSPINPRPSTIPFMSPLTADWQDPAQLDATYWCQTLRHTVEFEGATCALLSSGHHFFVEISPHPNLTMAIQETAESRGYRDALAVGSLQRGEGGMGRFLSSLAKAHVHGIPVDWRPAFDGLAVKRVRLPSRDRRPHPESAAATERHRQPVAGPAPEAADALLETILAEMAVITGVAATDASLSFWDLGFDSATALELRDRIKAATGKPLPATLVFDYPSPAKLARYLAYGGRLDDIGPPTNAPVHDEPIAVVAASCRFPGGVRSPEDLWAFTVGGSDAVSSFPADRGWDVHGLYDPDPDHPGRFYQKEAAFLDEASQFDADFFGISPREAVLLDPQQRILLEISWEAFERAGITRTAMAGSRTGVFIGATAQDYGPRLHEAPENLQGYVYTGSTPSVASGRIAYSFGLEGPALTIDTACSSSLVAMHLACQSLRNGECDLALAGGATVMATLGMFVEFSRLRGLAPDGRCKAFAAAADGTGWSEGAGLVLLERLPDARAKGHPVLAVIRGSAVNQDGASNGLTAPNGPSQERMIRAALAAARLSAADVDAVEAHGTGTTLGDPIEAQALINTYGADPARVNPLWLGSVKSNIGHTQAAAGVAGVIKMIAAMQHGQLPRTLHVDAPSPHVDWAAGQVALLTEPRPWPDTGRPRRAGVSSFGISGTNAHFILEQAPQARQTASQPTGLGNGLVLWPLSGRTPEAVRAAAGRLARWLDDRPDADPVQVGYSLATTRTHFEHRAVLAGTGPQVRAGLAALAAGHPHPAVVTGSTAGAGRTAFMFTGQGAQRSGMGAGLYTAFPVFAQALDQACHHLDPLLGCSLREVMFAAAGTIQRELLDQTRYTQPALFAFESALYALLRSLGLRPDRLAGHSVGEITAAHAAGVLSLADACALVAARAQLMAALPPGGTMIAIAAPEQDVGAMLPEGAGIAAVNGPAATVISGDDGPVRAAAQYWAARGIKTRVLPVSHAFHSARIDPVLGPLVAAAAALDYHPPQIPVISAVTGQLADPAALTDPGYWARQARATVRFADAVAALATDHVTTYLEVGPSPVLSSLAADCLSHAEPPHPEPAVIAASRETGDEPAALVAALAAAHAHGGSPDWAAFYPAGTPVVPLPTYPFQHQSYWLQTPAAASDLPAAGLAGAGHPLLAAAATLPDGTLLLTGCLTGPAAWLPDYATRDTVILPGTTLADLAVHVAAVAGVPQLTELSMHTPLARPAGAALRLQVSAGPPGFAGHRHLAIHSQPVIDTGQPWTCHATGTATPGRDQADLALEWAASWPPPGATPVNVDGLCDQFAAADLDYGPSFPAIERAWLLEDAIYAEASAARTQHTQSPGIQLPPALLDPALLSILCDALEEQPGDGTPLPPAPSAEAGHIDAGITRLALVPAGPGQMSLSIASPDAGFVTIDSLSLGPGFAGRRAVFPPLRAKDLFQMTWIRIPAAAPSFVKARTWAIIDSESELTSVVASASIDATCYPDLAALRDGMTTRDSVPDFILAPLYSVSASTGTAADRAHAVTRYALKLIQGFQADGLLSASALVVLTRGSNVVLDGDDISDPGAAAVCGLIRSAQAENPGQIIMVDLDPAGPIDNLLPAALVAHEAQVAIRNDDLYVPRLRYVTSPAPLAVPQGTNWRLEMVGEGVSRTPAFIDNSIAQRSLEGGEVRISIRAAGTSSLDGAGIIVEAAPDVTKIAVGDRVMGLLPHAFSPISVVDHRLIARIPDGWSFAEAATVPVAFLTAYNCIADLADLQAGQKLLIHDAADSVGMAAVQLARRRGAEVFATAAPDHWTILRAMGLDSAHIASSGTSDFERNFMGAAGGQRMDAIINVRHDIDLIGQEPDWVERTLASLLESFEAGELRALPTATWDVGQAPAALASLAQGRPAGTCVFTMPPPVPAEGTVLITGGTGALGALIARHLAAGRGARHLLLISRRGGQSDKAADLEAELTSLGTEVTIASCDAADRDDLARVLESIPADRPLTAVIHAAGTLDDATVSSLTPERLASVLRSKADAAWNLHELTKDIDLSEFIMFSSVTGSLGSAGQGNYSAANSFLDALAYHRRRHGRPAVSMAWGPWQGSGGMADRLGEITHAHFNNSGLVPIDADYGLALFETARTVNLPVVIPTRWDLGKLRERSGDSAVPASLRGLLRPLPPATASSPVLAETSPAGDWRKRLGDLPEARQRQILVDLVRTEAATVLGHTDPARTRADQTFREAGFDSLSAVRLRNRLNTSTGLRLPATLLFDHPTWESVAECLRSELAPVSSAAAAPSSVLADLRRLRQVVLGMPRENGILVELTELLQEFTFELYEMRGDAKTMDSSIPEELMRYGSEQNIEPIDFEANER
jgi:acyl transferase domain-containing protein/NADPH:quinone reductase-like Zn-dependent oxidoreductase